jgi:hypothetical protein
MMSIQDYIHLDRLWSGLAKFNDSFSVLTGLKIIYCQRRTSPAGNWRTEWLPPGVRFDLRAANRHPA